MDLRHLTDLSELLWYEEYKFVVYDFYLNDRIDQGDILVFNQETEIECNGQLMKVWVFFRRLAMFNTIYCKNSSTTCKIIYVEPELMYRMVDEYGHVQFVDAQNNVEYYTGCARKIFDK
jgi:hypothetical protein